MNTTAQVKQAIKKSGQQLAQEPLELLKAARSQVTGEEEQGRGQYMDPEEEAAEKKKQENEILKQQVAVSDQRHLEALQNEMIDIKRQKLFNEILQRIQGGEDVSIEEFQELTHEQRDVLKAQLEAAQQRKEQDTKQQVLVEPSTRRDRKMGAQRKAADKQTTRVEKPVPPSG